MVPKWPGEDLHSWSMPPDGDLLVKEPARFFSAASSDGLAAVHPNASQIPVGIAFSTEVAQQGPQFERINVSCDPRRSWNGGPEHVTGAVLDILVVDVCDDPCSMHGSEKNKPPPRPAMQGRRGRMRPP